MKKTLLFMACAISFCTVTLAQKEEKESKSAPPQAAKASFSKSFPGATNVRWGKEDANYEAEFRQNGKSMSAEFDEKGTLVESELSIKTSELPASVLQYLKEHYKGFSVKEAAKITKPNGEINYEAEVNKIDVIFDVNGKFIKEVKD